MEWGGFASFAHDGVGVDGLMFFTLNVTYFVYAFPFLFPHLLVHLSVLLTFLLALLITNGFP